MSHPHGSEELAEELVRRGRSRLLCGSDPREPSKRQPNIAREFYGHLACTLKLRPDYGIPTFATDGIHLFFNPDFAMTLTKTQMEFVLAHEVHHVYLKHPLRGAKACSCKHIDGTPHSTDCLIHLFILVADYPINAALKDSGADVIPQSLMPKEEHWRDSAEQHFNRMKKDFQKHQQCGGGCSGVVPIRGLSKSEEAALDAELTNRILQAAEFARSEGGSLPADIASLIDELRAPRLNYVEILRRFMTVAAKSDYKMSPPNRRHVYRGEYLPSLHSEATNTILLLLDGSGSTWEFFDQFMGDFVSIYEDARPLRMCIMVWDVRCGFYKELSVYDGESAQTLLGLSQYMKRGGGTVLTDCFNWLSREHDDICPDAAIVLTDMELYGAWPDDPGYPVLWIANSNIQAPWGETVKVE